jgi:hypothetical protein
VRAVAEPIEDLRDHKPGPADVEWREARTALLERHTNEQARSNGLGHDGSPTRGKIRAWLAGRKRHTGES